LDENITDSNLLYPIKFPLQQLQEGLIPPHHFFLCRESHLQDAVLASVMIRPAVRSSRIIHPYPVDDKPVFIDAGIEVLDQLPSFRVFIQLILAGIHMSPDNGPEIKPGCATSPVIKSCLTRPNQGSLQEGRVSISPGICSSKE